MTTKLKWRLANRPTPAEVKDLHAAGLLTKDEAREILFSQETDDDRDKVSLQGEVKFLRDLVQRLATSPIQIIQTIKAIENPYTKLPWFSPYVNWAESTSNAMGGLQLYQTTTTGNTTYAMNSQSSSDLSDFSNGLVDTLVDHQMFADIKTF